MISNYHERIGDARAQLTSLCDDASCGKLRPLGSSIRSQLQEEAMERIVFLTFRSHQILLADCSDCSPEELTAVIDEVPRHVTQHPVGSLLVLADFSRSVFTKETVEHLKISAVFDRPHIKKSAWVLTQNLPKTLYESVLSFSGREIPTFKTREEALEYLVAEP
jgi:hypothetical protein